MMADIAGRLVYVVERLKEPGSQRTITFLCGIFNVPGVQMDNWLGVATTVAAIIAVFTPETLPAHKMDAGFSK